MYMGKLISFQYSLCLRGKIKKKEVIVVPTVFKYFFRCFQCRLSSMTFLQCIPMFPFSWSSVDIKCQRKKSWSPAINITLGYEINSNRVSGNFASNDNICEQHFYLQYNTFNRAIRIRTSQEQNVFANQSNATRVRNLHLQEYVLNSSLFYIFTKFVIDFLSIL